MAAWARLAAADAVLHTSSAVAMQHGDWLVLCSLNKQSKDMLLASCLLLYEAAPQRRVHCFK